jgi:hypothetical protein
MGGGEEEGREETGRLIEMISVEFCPLDVKRAVGW